MFNAIQRRHYQVAKILLEAGANVNTTELAAVMPMVSDRARSFGKAIKRENKHSVSKSVFGHQFSSP